MPKPTKVCPKAAKNNLERHQMGFDGEQIGLVTLQGMGKKSARLTRHTDSFDILTNKEAWEVKTCSKAAKDIKMTVKPHQAAKKLRVAKEMGKEPKSMLIVIDGSADIYVADGIKAFRPEQMKKLKRVNKWRETVGHGRRSGKGIPEVEEAPRVKPAKPAKPAKPVAKPQPGESGLLTQVFQSEIYQGIESKRVEFLSRCGVQESSTIGRHLQAKAGVAQGAAKDLVKEKSRLAKQLKAAGFSPRLTEQEILTRVEGDVYLETLRRYKLLEKQLAGATSQATQAVAAVQGGSREILLNIFGTSGLGKQKLLVETKNYSKVIGKELYARAKKDCGQVISWISRMAGGAPPRLLSRKAIVGIWDDIGRASYFGEDKLIRVGTSHAQDSMRLRKSISHEMGHFLEQRTPKARQLLNDFYERRTAGETEDLLGRGFSAEEKTKRDQFVRAYAGKTYSPLQSGGLRRTELLSVGLEELYTDPVSFARLDPEHFNLILAILQGAL